MPWQLRVRRRCTYRHQRWATSAPFHSYPVPGYVSLLFSNGQSLSIVAYDFESSERATRIELAFSAWEVVVRQYLNLLKVQVSSIFLPPNCGHFIHRALCGHHRNSPAGSCDVAVRCDVLLLEFQMVSDCPFVVLIAIYFDSEFLTFSNQPEVQFVLILRIFPTWCLRGITTSYVRHDPETWAEAAIPIFYQT